MAKKFEQKSTLGIPNEVFYLLYSGERQIIRTGKKKKDLE